MNKRKKILAVLLDRGATTASNAMSRKKLLAKLAKRIVEDERETKKNKAIDDDELRTALERLVRKGRVYVEGKRYYAPSNDARESDDDDDDKDDDANADTATVGDDALNDAVSAEETKSKETPDEHESPSSPPLTFAEMMRRKRKRETFAENDRRRDEPPSFTTTTTDSGDFVPPWRRTAKRVAEEENGSAADENVDLDEEIKRLEAELDDDDDVDSGSGSDDESGDDDSVRGRYNAKKGDTNNDGDGVICLSTVSSVDDRIVPLPRNLLPSNRRKTLKGIDGAKRSSEGSKKRKRKGDNDGDRDSERKSDHHQHDEGLRETVKELLAGYVARSSERIPFYCRVCRVRSADEEDFRAHRATALHRAAVAAERKACYCRVCRKQLTSPAQMKEHLTSKPHRERMDRVTAGQRRAGRSGGGGRGATGGSANSRQGERQWC